jgi:hypothetical protein
VYVRRSFADIGLVVASVTQRCSGSWSSGMSEPLCVVTQSSRFPQRLQ